MKFSSPNIGQYGKKILNTEFREQPSDTNIYIYIYKINVYSLLILS